MQENDPLQMQNPSATPQDVSAAPAAPVAPETLQPTPVLSGTPQAPPMMRSGPAVVPAPATTPATAAPTAPETTMTQASNPDIKNRNIILCVVFTLLTFGIYGIYWFIKITDETVKVNNSKVYKTSGVLAFILPLLTFGIYGLYWAYKMGKALYSAKADRGLAGSDQSVIYLILNLFALNLVTCCLIQNDLNNMSS